MKKRSKRTVASIRVENPNGLSAARALLKWYHSHDKSVDWIRKEVDVSYPTVFLWFKAVKEDENGGPLPREKGLKGKLPKGLSINAINMFLKENK